LFRQAFADDYYALQGVMIAKLLREPFDFVQTGISTDYSAPKAASIMLASASLYLAIEVLSVYVCIPCVRTCVAPSCSYMGCTVLRMHVLH